MSQENGSSPLKFDSSPTPSKRSRVAESEEPSGEATSASRALFSTPSRRFRTDPGSSVKHHRTFVPENDDVIMEPSEPSNATGPRVFIWGTRICVSEVQSTFRKFLEEYQQAKPDEDELMLEVDLAQRNIDSTLSFYMQKIEEIYHSEEPHLNINLQHVKDFSDSLYRQIICYPADIVPYLDMEVNNLFAERFPNEEFPYQIQIRPYNADRTRNMRSLNPEDIDQLITINGMVIRSSFLIPEMRLGLFECVLCRHTVEVEIDRGRIEEPILCQHCGTNHSFQLIHNRCMFMDKQIVKLQEAPDDMPAGQTPHTVALHCYGELVDVVQPGDRITVTGIYRAVPLRVMPRQRVVKSVYKTYVDVLHFRKADVHRLHTQDDGSKMTPDRIAQLQDLAKKPDIYDRLAHAIAPSIYEHDDIKRGILCLLFGGTKKKFDELGRDNFRADINVLLCGDPGTSKSQLLQYVHHLVPRGQYTSGKGSSAVGLTAYVTRDPETHHFVLQPGALVLSDNGICCIDEFDKMSDSTRSVLHEVMEQQTLSIAKAGIICQLNARTSLLAAANPVDSQWNKNKTILENVQLPHTLLSRFDLIFLLVDPQDEYYDRRLAKHLVSLYYRNQEEEDAELLDMSLLRDYISYAKCTCNPTLSDEASQNLIEKYVAMRKLGSGRGQVSAYPRQLESLIRLSEAHAKIRLSAVVEISDVEEAYRLHREALKQSATDPLTGKVDVNILAAGMSTTTRKHVAEVADAVVQRLGEKPFGVWVPLRRLLADVRQNSDKMVTRELYDDAVNELCKNDVVAKGREGQVRLLKPIDKKGVSAGDQLSRPFSAD